MSKSNPIYTAATLIILAGFCAIVLMQSFAADLTSITPVGPYPASVAANDLDFSWTASTGSDATDTITATGRDLLLMHNSGESIRYVTLDSVPDTFNRQNDVSSYALGVGEYAAFLFSNSTGWKNATGEILISTSHADVTFAVMLMPR